LCCERHGTWFPYLDNIRGAELVTKAKATIEAVVEHLIQPVFVCLKNTGIYRHFFVQAFILPLQS
jgi:hypothetical protein